MDNVIRFMQGLHARLAAEAPPVRRTLAAILLVMPGGLGIVFFYLLLRGPRVASERSASQWVRAPVTGRNPTPALSESAVGRPDSR